MIEILDDILILKARELDLHNLTLDSVPYGFYASYITSKDVEEKYQRAYISRKEMRRNQKSNKKRIGDPLKIKKIK